MTSKPSWWFFPKAQIYQPLFPTKDVTQGVSRIQKGGDIYVHIADSLYGTAEANTIFQSNYTPTKQRKNKKLQQKAQIKSF